MRHHFLWPVAVLILVSIAAAQNDGDAVVGTSWGSNAYLLAVSPGAVVKTILTRPNTATPDGLAAAPANDGGLMVERTQNPWVPHVLKFQNGVGVTTLATLPTSFGPVPTLLVDAGGDILILNQIGTDRGVYRMPGRGGPLATLAHNNLNASFLAPFAMAEEPVSGDILVLDINSNMHRIDRRGKVTTLRVVFPPGTSIVVTGNVHVDHGSGLMHVTYGNHFLTLDPNTGAITTIYQPSSASRSTFYGLDGDPFGGGYFLGLNRYSPAPTGPFLMRYDPQGSALSTAATLPNGNLGDVLTWRSRMLGGLSRPRHGTPYQVRFAIPCESGQAYFAAASLGTFPGIPIGKYRRVPLNPDALFFRSIQAPLMFSNFQGMLSATGTATLTVNIPGIPQLVGYRFFLGAVTLDGRGIRIITEPLGVTIE